MRRAFNNSGPEAAMSIALDLDHASNSRAHRAPRTRSLVGLSKPELREALGGIGLDERESQDARLASSGTGSTITASPISTG